MSDSSLKSFIHMHRIHELIFLHLFTDMFHKDIYSIVSVNLQLLL